MRIEGLGDVLAIQMVEANLVKDVGDLYSLTLDQVAALPRMAKKVRDQSSRPDRSEQVARAHKSDLRARHGTSVNEQREYLRTKWVRSIV